MTADRIKALEDALQELLDGDNWRAGKKFDPNSGNFDLSKQRAALAASRTASDCQQPDLVTAARVKPLVWGYHPMGWIAAPPTGQAYIIDIRVKGRVMFVKGMNPPPQFDTIEAAKAAAQADYEARILAALDLTPPTPQDAARVPEIAGQIREITEADMANIVAHLSYECEPTGPLPNANSLMMEVVRLRNKLAALRAIAGGDA